MIFLCRCSSVPIPRLPKINSNRGVHVNEGQGPKCSEARTLTHTFWARVVDCRVLKGGGAMGIYNPKFPNTPHNSLGSLSYPKVL